MLECNRLRIDLGDGFHAVDYRIQYDNVESRTLETGSEANHGSEHPWHRLTADQLTSHVMAGTVVARWLRGRMGLHRLIRACNQVSSSSFGGHEDQERQDRTVM